MAATIRSTVDRSFRSLISLPVQVLPRPSMNAPLHLQAATATATATTSRSGALAKAHPVCIIKMRPWIPVPSRLPLMRTPTRTGAGTDAIGSLGTLDRNAFAATNPSCVPPSGRETVRLPCIMHTPKVSTAWPRTRKKEKRNSSLIM